MLEEAASSWSKCRQVRPGQACRQMLVRQKPVLDALAVYECRSLPSLPKKYETKLLYIDISSVVHRILQIFKLQRQKLPRQAAKDYQGSSKLSKDAHVHNLATQNLREKEVGSTQVQT